MMIDANAAITLLEKRSDKIIVPVRLSLRPAWSIDFGDVFQTNGPE